MDEFSINIFVDQNTVPKYEKIANKFDKKSYRTGFQLPFCNYLIQVPSPKDAHLL